MDAIKELTQINYGTLIIAICTILLAFKFMWTLFDWFIKLLGLETRSMRLKREEHELLIKTSEALNELKDKEAKDTERAIKHDKAIKDDLAKLTTMFVEKEINDYRWEINNFATKISENKSVNKDCFKHCFKTYALYEKILEENNLKNGEVENSMQIINDAYQDKMKNGKL